MKYRSPRSSRWPSARARRLWPNPRIADEKAKEIIDKAGAWFTVDGNRIQGRDGVKQYLADNPEVCDRIEQEIRDNAHKLMSPQAMKAAQAAGRTAAPAPAVDVSAADFDED